MASLSCLAAWIHTCLNADSPLCMKQPSSLLSMFCSPAAVTVPAHGDHLADGFELEFWYALQLSRIAFVKHQRSAYVGRIKPFVMQLLTAVGAYDKSTEDFVSPKCAELMQGEAAIRCMNAHSCMSMLSHMAAIIMQ